MTSSGQRDNAIKLKTRGNSFVTFGANADRLRYSNHGTIIIHSCPFTSKCHRFVNDFHIPI